MDLNADSRRMQQRHGDARDRGTRRAGEPRYIPVWSEPRRHRVNSLISAWCGWRRRGRKLLRNNVLNNAKDQKSQQVPSDQTSSGDSHSDGQDISERKALLRAKFCRTAGANVSEIGAGQEFRRWLGRSLQDLEG